MQFENTVYAANGSINSLVDGKQTNFPANPNNRHFRKMTAQGITPGPVPTLTDAEVDAEMDASTGTPEMLSILEAIAARLPEPVTVDELRADARARGRVNLPRN